MSTNRKIIGTIHYPAGTVDKSYETASWYTTVEYDAQTVDLVLADIWILARIEGRITKEYFPSSFAGNMTGGGSFSTDTGEPTTYTFQMYDYSIANRVAAGDPAIELAAGWELTSRTHDHPIRCMGYSYVATSRGELPRTVGCEHDRHVDHRGVDVGRDNRGHLQGGYVPDAFETMTHYSVKPVAA